MTWVVAGGAAVLWCVLFGVLAVATEPRRVDPGAPTLDLPGTEPAAVVALVTGDWEVDRDAVTATVLDLAARRHLAIDWIAPHTFLRVRTRGPEGRSPSGGSSGLTPYEEQVLTHVRELARETTDGVVPAAALTTGPAAQSRSWWKRFEGSVVADARARGLSRPRWSTSARTALLGGAIVVGLAVGVAASTIPHDDTDDDPVGTAVALGVLTTGALGVLAGRARGERDTAAGRAVAARWLGVREMLGDDPMFAVQPPAAVAVWGRLMAYGSAMGLTGTAAAALPLGAERERHAWSPVGDRWRPVRIRYPDVLPPGYGHHPALVTFLGTVATLLGVAVASGALALAGSVGGGTVDLVRSDTVPWAVRLAVGLVVATIVAAGTFAVLAGLTMLAAGFADLVRPRRTVEGRVLRVRERSDGRDHRYWHVAVDDGTTDRIRAWRVDDEPRVAQGDTVRASVSRALGHVRDLTVVARRGEPVTVAPGAVIRAPGEPGGPPAARLPLPGADEVGAALGCPVHAVPDAVVHPLAVEGASATYVADDGGRVVTAWVPPAHVAALATLPRSVAPAVPGIGEEAYRAPEGGGILARVGTHALLVAAALPDTDHATRDGAVSAVARLVAGLAERPAEPG